MIEISSNIKDVTGAVRDIAGQIPFATAKALNQTARDLQAAEFDLPYPDGSRMALVPEAIAAFETRLKVKL